MSRTPKYYKYNEDGSSVDFPWLNHTCMDLTFDKGYQYIEYQNFLSSKVNEKVSEADYDKGIRYLKVKLLGKMTADKFSKFTPVDSKSKIQRKFCRIQPNELLELDLNQQELSEGFRYLRIYVPFDILPKGWITMSEKEDGWQVAGKKRSRKSVSTHKSRRKQAKRARDPKMMEEVKKYISIQS